MAGAVLESAYALHKNMIGAVQEYGSFLYAGAKVDKTEICTIKRTINF